MSENENKEINQDDQELNENPFTNNKEEEVQESVESVETAEIEKAETTENAENDSELEKLSGKLKDTEEELKTQKSQYVRLAADFDNYRKRQASERESLLKYGAEDTAKKLLPILDTIERAEKSFTEIDDPQKLKESFEAIKKQFSDSFEKIGLIKIETVGKKFDPNFHEAVMQTQSTDHPDQSIITELQSGYTLHKKTLRPAMVNVAVQD